MPKTPQVPALEGMTPLGIPKTEEQRAETLRIVRALTVFAADCDESARGFESRGDTGAASALREEYKRTIALRDKMLTAMRATADPITRARELFESSRD